MGMDSTRWHFGSLSVRLLIQYTTVGTLAFCCYVNSLSAGFVYDDSRAIQRNRDLLPSSPWSNLLWNDFWGTSLHHSGSHRSYRPLCVASFRLNYMFGGLEPFGYHLVNVLLHAIVSTLFLQLVRQFCSRHDEGVSYLSPPFLSALLFAAHPVHTEAVSGVVGRAEIGAALFFLLSFFSYRTACKSTPWKLQGMWIIATVVLALAAMLWKEQGITVLGICASYDIICVHHVSIFNLRRLFQKSLLCRVCILIISVVLLLFARFAVMGGAPPNFSPADNPAASCDSQLTRAMTFLFLPVLNFWLLICPRFLSFDWSMDAIPLVEQPSDVRNLLTISFYVLFGAIAYKSLLRKGSDRQCVLMALVFIALPFLPATNLLFYVGFVVAERILYIPSIGFCLLVALAVKHLSTVRLLSLKKAAAWLCLLLAVIYSVRTWQRNQDWQNELTLYRSGIAVNPAKGWGNLANVLKEDGQIEEAETAYRKALSHRGNMADAHYNLGLLLQEEHRYDEAIESYQKAVQYRPKLAAGHLNLGIVLKELGRVKEAETVFRHTITLSDHGLKDPYTHSVHVTSAKFALAKLYHDRHDYELAIKLLEDAEGNAPEGYELHSIYNILGDSHAQIGSHQRAERYFKKSLAVKSDHVPVHLTYGQLLSKMNKVEDAEALFKQALLLAPWQKDVHTYYAIFLKERGRHHDALRPIERALSIAPNDSQVVHQAAEIYRANNNADLALKMYEEVTKLQPNDAGGFSNLGAMLHISGQFHEAEQAYARSLQLSPNNQLTKENLKKLQSSMKKRGLHPTHVN